jgi:acyl carrier protein
MIQGQVDLNQEKVIQSINDLLHEEFEVDRSKLLPSADLKATLDLDSLDYVDLVVLIEKILHFKVDPSDLADFRNLQDVYNYVIAKMELKHSYL